MEKLPPEIVLDIFYRLPPESVVACKFVCKPWHNLLPRGDDDGNYFANMNLHRRRRHHDQQSNLDNSTLNFISLHEFRDEDEEGSVVGEFHFTEYDDEVEGLLNCKVKRLVFTQICISGWLSVIRLDGSCNGLLCFTITYHRGGTTNDYLKNRIGICNPFLHEYITFPPSDLQFKYDDCEVVIGFGHNPITDEYKLVRVCYRHFDSVIGDVEVYTLGKNGNGAGMWRSKGTIKYRLRSWSRYVLINGSIHWFANTGSTSEQNIVSFDLEDEEFRVMPLPSDLNITSWSQLGELRGCLCLIGDTRDTLPLGLNINLDIWVLKEYMNKKSWVKEFKVNWKGQPCYSPCAIKKKKDGDGDSDGDEILCWCNSKSTKTLVSYDSKTQNFEEVGGTQVVSVSQEPFLYINSLVSLKALGEDAKPAVNHPKTKT